MGASRQTALWVCDGRVAITCERHPEGEDCSLKPMCKSARMIMYLGPDERVLPRIAMSEAAAQERFPLVQEMGLAAALSDSYYLEFVRATLGTYLEANPECASCEYKNRCAGGCRARAALASPDGSLTSRDQDMCAFFCDGYYNRATELIAKLQQV